MRRKVYGESKKEECIFCGSGALFMNGQGLPVCKDHKNRKLEDRKCICGEWLEIKKSKWGPFFACRNCGAISIKKAMEMDHGGFKLNKKYREKNDSRNSVSDNVDSWIKDPQSKARSDLSTRKAERVYTLKELEDMWEDK